jgi:hypothetical protein
MDVEEMASQSQSARLPDCWTQHLYIKKWELAALWWR